MTQLFANNAASELASPAAPAATTLALKAGGGTQFPAPSGGDYFLVTLYQKAGMAEINHEIVMCTAREGDTLTVVRAQEGTAARAFNAADPVELRLTAGAVGEAFRSAAWTNITDKPSLVPEAPIDGKQYARKDAAWVEAGGGDATPPGTVIFYAKNTAPAGYLKANGAAVSRTTYAALFAAIGTTFGVGDNSTTFGLPDLRGQFLRGWVDNGSVDSGRAFGSGQVHAYLNHSHTATGATNSTGGHTHTMEGVPSMDRAGGSSFNSAMIKGATTTTGLAGDHAHTVSVSISNSTTGSTETRPVNVALLACVKY